MYLNVHAGRGCVSQLEFPSQKEKAVFTAGHLAPADGHHYLLDSASFPHLLSMRWEVKSDGGQEGMKR